MRHIIRTTLMAVATSVVAISILSGCTSAPDNSYEGMPEPTETSYVYFNIETGKITKITDETGEATYEEGASDVDSRMVRYDSSGPTDSSTLERSITLEGKPYPVEVSIGLSMNVTDRDALITFYNEHIAAPEPDTIQPPDPYFSLWGEVLGFVKAQVQAREEAGQLSGLQIIQTGESSHQADTRIADAWRSGVPAWQAWESFGDGTVSSTSSPSGPNPSGNVNNPPQEPEYYYSFYCASYGVELAGKEEVLNSLNTLTGKELVSLSIHSSVKEVAIETAEPCEVSALYLQPKSYSNDVAPPPPPGNWEY